VRWTTGEDIRQHGSGSSGARNVGRSLGRWAFVATMAGDIAKGAAAPALARATGSDPARTGIAAAAVVAGHVWPVYLGFRGGRGLTTALGAALAIDRRVALSAVAVAAASAPITRSFTTAGLVGTASAPLVAALLRTGRSESASVTAIAAIVAVGHRPHLRILASTLKPAAPRLNGEHS
jgi:glycerol-3-phosphate acyltransferase PlsY